MDPIETVAIEALRNAQKTVSDLGESSKIIVNTKQRGEIALKADIEAEKTVIATLRKAKIPIRIISEEHGVVDIMPNPIYLGTLDGIDGTDALKRGTDMYATMLSIFKNIDPRYKDFLFNGMIEHSKGNLYHTIPGQKSFMGNIPLLCNPSATLDKSTLIFIDEYIDINIRTFTDNLKGFNTKCLGSSSHYYASLLSGEAALMLECTRKGNLEVAAAYGLVTNAGGCIVTLDGQDIGDRKYNEFGQKEQIPLITAANRAILAELRAHLQL